MILPHKLGKTYPSFQTNWFDNIWNSGNNLFHWNCNDRSWKTFFSLWLLMNNFSVQQFLLLKEKKMTIELRMIVNQAKHRASKAFWKMQVIVKKVFWIKIWAEHEDLYETNATIFFFQFFVIWNCWVGICSYHMRANLTRTWILFNYKWE